MFFKRAVSSNRGGCVVGTLVAPSFPSILCVWVVVVVSEGGQVVFHTHPHSHSHPPPTPSHTKNSFEKSVFPFSSPPPQPIIPIIIKSIFPTYILWWMMSTGKRGWGRPCRLFLFLCLIDRGEQWLKSSWEKKLQHLPYGFVRFGLWKKSHLHSTLMLYSIRKACENLKKKENTIPTLFANSLFPQQHSLVSKFIASPFPVRRDRGGLENKKRKKKRNLLFLPTSIEPSQ